MTDQLITRVPKNEVQEIKTRNDILVAEAQAIVSRVDLEAKDDVIMVLAREAGDFVKMVGTGLKDMEKKRKQFTAGLNASLKEINGTFKELKAKPDEAKQIASKAVIALQGEQQRRIREENERIERENEANRKAEEQARKIQEKHAEPGEAIIPVILPREAQKVEPTKAVETRSKWAFNIEDIASIALKAMVIVYLIKTGKYAGLLEMMIRDQIRDSEDPATLDIEGVKIFKEETIVIR